MPQLRKVIFIDRDGTIIKEPDDEQIDSLEKLEFIPGVIGALSSLMGKGFEIVMVSNQDGLGTYSFPECTFWPAHNKMLSTLEGEGIKFDAQFIDPSFPEDNSPNRKPGIGMLLSYMDGSCNLADSFVIGDRLSDIELAGNLGAKGIMLSSEIDEKPENCVLVTSDWNEIARYILSSGRTIKNHRKTSETEIFIKLDLDGNGKSEIDTGLKFFDHMLWQLPHHAGISLSLKCKGDLEVDEHHTIEDVGIALGDAILTALGDKRGIERYGFALPMDECEASVLIDLGGRIDFQWDVYFTREYIGDVPTEMFRHFFQSVCHALRCNLHIKATGENNHHLIEGVFKAFARALRMAVRRDPFNYDLPSSKGIL